MPSALPSGEYLTAYLLPGSASRAEVSRGWMAVFDLVTPLMGFSHIGMVARPGPSVQLDADIRQLGEAAVTSAGDALPSRDGPRPLGVHVELKDSRIRSALRRSGPHLLNARIYAESDRLAIAQRGIANVPPMIDIDDFGEVLRVTLSKESMTRCPDAAAIDENLQAWLDEMAHAP